MSTLPPNTEPIYTTYVQVLNNFFFEHLLFEEQLFWTCNKTKKIFELGQNLECSDCVSRVTGKTSGESNPFLKECLSRINLLLTLRVNAI